jgi:hypothetical protein
VWREWGAAYPGLYPPFRRCCRPNQSQLDRNKCGVRFRASGGIRMHCAGINQLPARPPDMFSRETTDFDSKSQLNLVSLPDLFVHHGCPSSSASIRCSVTWICIPLRRQKRPQSSTWSVFKARAALDELCLTNLSNPGPPTLPIIGNLHQIPKKGAHLK